MAVDKKLDLFWFLGQLDAKNFDVLVQLDAEQLKEVSNYMTLRWLSGCDDPEQLIALGTFGTSCIFDLDQHPELITKVLAACTKNGRKRYRWINYKGAAKESMAVELVAKQWQLTRKKAEDARKQLSNADIMELGRSHGLQADELKKLEKELV